MTLSLIIPCYNEERTLQAIVQRTLQLCSPQLGLELIIVDDCSIDKSLVAAQHIAAQMAEQNAADSGGVVIKVFHHEKNMGKGAALRTGFMAATGDYVGVQDADNEYSPLDYLMLLEPLQAGRADVVYGSRYLKPGTRRVLYYWHTWMNKMLTRFSNMFTNMDITDMETCYKLFRRSVIQEIAPRLKENRFGFEPEVTALVSQGGYRVYECAISYSPRTYEEGKKINWKDGVHALYCIFHYSAPCAPLPMQLIIYFFIGAISAAANIVFFLLFNNCTVLTLWQSTIAAFAISAAVNYVLCILVLFRHKARWSSGGEIAAYIFTLLVMGSFDFGVTRGLIAAGVSAAWSKAWASVVGFFGNYILRRVLVFGGKNGK